MDRAARVLLGIVLTIVGFAPMSGGAGIAVGLIGLILLLTGLAGWCPAYRLISFNTLGVR
jgi:hypothetical protein